MISMRSRRAPVLTKVIVLVWAAVIIAPFYWLIVTSIKPEQALISAPNPLPWIHFTPDLGSYEYLFRTGADKVVSPFWNSVVAGVGSSIIALVVGSMGAYALARFDFGPKGRVNDVVAFGFLATRMLPAAVLLIPYLVAYRITGLLDTQIGLIIVYAAGGIPYTVWILRAFFRGLPKEIEESAKVDGASDWKVYTSIALPLAAPAHIAMFILLLVGAWNELLIALTVTFVKAGTLPIFLVLQNESLLGPSWGRLAAMTILAMLPMLILGVGLQRYVRSGLTTGAFK